MSTILETKQVTKKFAGLVAINDVSFKVEEGKIVGMIGPNGAGKTTMLNLVCGTYPPSSGRIFYEGREITGYSPHRLCGMGIARTFQVPKPFPQHTVLKNVMVGAIFGRRKASESQAEEEALKQLTILELAEKQGLKASALNHMELKKMEIARALATDPRLLFLDEPAAGLTPTEVNWLIETIRKTNKTGVTIVLIEHILKAVMSLSDRIVVLNHGDLLAEGTPQEIAEDEEVVQAYLGEKHVGAV